MPRDQIDLGASSHVNHIDDQEDFTAPSLPEAIGRDADKQDDEIKFRIPDLENVPPHPYEYLNHWQDYAYQTALVLAELGWPVFPVNIDGKGDKKGFKSGSKINGQRWGATLDPNDIARDWASFPDCALGIATGHKAVDCH